MLMGGSFFINAQDSKPSTNTLPPIILLLDGSGSMWGQIDGKSKIEIAREVVGNLLDKMDPNRPIGLLAYGHRKKGDCADIETLMEPKTANRDEIKSILRSINPVGKTPLANTALQVIKKLKSDGNSATVILVSDGAESCGGDLCAVVKAAKEAGVDFVLHIVGFDIGESDKLALQCAAREGDGVYLDAANGDELSAALAQTTELTIESTNATLSVKVTKDGELHDAAVQIFVDGEQKYFTSLRTYNHKDANPAMFHIPSGTYHIKAMSIGTNVQEIWRRDIEVPADEIKQLEIDFSAGNISIRTTANNELWDCSVSITKVGGTKNVAAGRTYSSDTHNPMLKELSPGLYDVKIKAMKLQGENISHTFNKVEVVAGETTEIAYNFEFGELSILATNNGELWDCVINTFKAGDAKKKSVGGGRTYNSSPDNPLTELLTPGSYSVHYRAHKLYGADWEHIVENLEVRAGEKTEAVHNFQTGIARIGARHKGALWTSTITLYQNGRSVYSKRTHTDAKNNPKEIVLTPGTYEVSVKPLKLEASTKKFSITIVAGGIVEKMLEF